MTTSRLLSLLAALASPVFMIAAVAGWLTGRIPATPLTLGVAAFLVVAGPVLALLHVTMVRADEDDEEDVTEVLTPTRVIAPPRPRLPELPVAPELAAARAFHRWREHPLPAIAERDREEERARRPYARI